MRPSLFPTHCAFDSTRQVSGHDFSALPDERSESRAAKPGTRRARFWLGGGEEVVPSNARKEQLLAPQARAPDARGFRVAGWRSARSCSQQAVFA